MATKLPSSKNRPISTTIWISVSLIFLDVNSRKVVDLRTEGRYVSPWQYAQAVFWLFILMFWIWDGWKSWQRYQADKG